MMFLEYTVFFLLSAIAVLTDEEHVLCVWESSDFSGQWNPEFGQPNNGPLVTSYQHCHFPPFGQEQVKA